MSNRSYLSVTNSDTIYPSTAEAEFTPDQQTVAQGVYCVPVLWFALFRPSDVRTQVFDVQRERVTGIAPISEVEVALAQLKAAMPNLNEMFRQQGKFDDYADLLSQAIESTGRKYVTIESAEIECIGDPDEFYDDFRAAINAINNAESLAVGRERLLKLSEIPASARFPSARCIIEKNRVSDREMDVHARIIGCAWIRKVPWE
jgi:hypothetical protein